MATNRALLYAARKVLGRNILFGAFIAMAIPILRFLTAFSKTAREIPLVELAPI